MKNLSKITRAVLNTAVCSGVLIALAPGAVRGGEAAGDGRDRYEARQAVSYEFGSKFTSGFFVPSAGKCLIRLMIIEKSSLDEPPTVTAARVRLSLYPGQVAGLDSEEGRSLNFTCGQGAEALLVDKGERDKLIASQRAFPEEKVGLATFP